MSKQVKKIYTDESTAITIAPVFSEQQQQQDVIPKNGFRLAIFLGRLFCNLLKVYNISKEEI